MQISAFLKKSTPSILSLSGWLVLASLAFETRWKRNEIRELLQSRSKKANLVSKVKDQNNSSLETLDKSIDNKAIII